MLRKTLFLLVKAQMYFTTFLFLINISSLNFGDIQIISRATGKQPYNSFACYGWGGLGDQQDGKYGWNITLINNLNGDAYPDLVISTPWYDSSTFDDVGSVYIFYGSSGSGFEDC